MSSAKSKLLSSLYLETPVTKSNSTLDVNNKNNLSNASISNDTELNQMLANDIPDIISIDNKNNDIKAKKLISNASKTYQTKSNDIVANASISKSIQSKKEPIKQNISNDSKLNQIIANESKSNDNIDNQMIANDSIQYQMIGNDLKAKDIFVRPSRELRERLGGYQDSVKTDGMKLILNTYICNLIDKDLKTRGY
jgi:hypothetical protein